MTGQLRIIAQLCKLLDEAETHDVSIYGNEDGDEFQVSWWTRGETSSRHYNYVLRQDAEGWNGTPIGMTE